MLGCTILRNMQYSKTMLSIEIMELPHWHSKSRIELIIVPLTFTCVLTHCSEIFQLCHM